MSIYSDKLAHVQVVINCTYSKVRALGHAQMREQAQGIDSLTLLLILLVRLKRKRLT